MLVAGLSRDAQIFGRVTLCLCPHHSAHHHQRRHWEGQGWGLGVAGGCRGAWCQTWSPRRTSSLLTAHSSAPFPGHPVDAVPAFCPCSASRIPPAESVVPDPSHMRTHGGPGRFHAQLQLLHLQTSRPAEVTDRTAERGSGPKSDTAQAVGSEPVPGSARQQPSDPVPRLGPRGPGPSTRRLWRIQDSHGLGLSSRKSFRFSPPKDTPCWLCESLGKKQNQRGKL